MLIVLDEGEVDLRPVRFDGACGMCRDVVCSGDDTSVAVISTPNIRNMKNYIIVYFCALSRIFARIKMTKIRMMFFQLTLTPWIRYYIQGYNCCLSSLQPMIVASKYIRGTLIYGANEIYCLY